MNRNRSTIIYLTFIVKIFKLNILCRILNFVIKTEQFLYCSIIETSNCMFTIFPLKSSHGKMSFRNPLKMVNKYEINTSSTYGTGYRNGLGHKFFSDLNTKPGG